jgi:hypothetical protein
MPTPDPRHMAALNRETEAQHHERTVLTRWERRLINRLMDRIARSLGWGSALQPPAYSPTDSIDVPR